MYFALSLAKLLVAICWLDFFILSVLAPKLDSMVEGDSYKAALLDSLCEALCY